MQEIDVIIPTYNRGYCLDRAITSVFKQTYAHWNLWVVDDGSTDNTPEVLAHWAAKDNRVRILSGKNAGVSAARNRAIILGKAPFIAFLDSDDEWLPDKLFQQVQHLGKDSDIPLVHTDEIWIRNGVRVNPMRKHRKQGGRIFKECLPLCCISPSATLIRRTLLEEVGLFREDFVVCEDYELWLRICEKYEVGFIEKPLIVKHGGHEDQLSRKFHSMDYYRVKAMQYYLKSPYLDGDELLTLKKQMRKKVQVLLKGSRKHENLKNYDDLFRIHSSVGSTGSDFMLSKSLSTMAP